LRPPAAFDPYASSPAGAEGVAQFIPSTAASYGLRNPFDPVEAIDAEAQAGGVTVHVRARRYPIKALDSSESRGEGAAPASVRSISDSGSTFFGEIARGAGALPTHSTNGMIARTRILYSR